jgi:hypothetical protein
MRTIAYFAALGILFGGAIVSFAYNLPVDAKGNVLAKAVERMR